MSVGRFTMRGRVFQGRAFAGRALADGGVTPSTRFGRFVAGNVYQSGVHAGNVYQAGIVRVGVYQSGIIQGQLQ